jgi:hypothetical protein
MVWESVAISCPMRSPPPMSDKTKYLADQALTRKRMIDWWRREQAKPKFGAVRIRPSVS